jgi:hypothetical protein
VVTDPCLTAIGWLLAHFRARPFLPFPPFAPMTATLDDVGKKTAAEQTAEQQAAVELVRLARERGLSLTGPDGLLRQLTKTVIETAL